MISRDECREKAKELVSKMTIEEVASQLLHQSPAVKRLGIPEYNWWSEGLHGVARAGIATVFPQAIGMAAAFDDAFMTEEAGVIAEEARAKYNAARRHGDRDIYKGLTYWSPNINIFRDPRWGRGHETYGEDPFLTEKLGDGFIEGLQQKDEKGYLKIAACAKHFAVHSGPEALRHGFDVSPTEKDFKETYLPAFESAVKDKDVEAVMTAYNRVFGEPCCANNRLLNDILKKEWGFEGHVVSDCWAVKDMHGDHHYTKTPEESASLAVKRGCDLNCGCTFESLLMAMEQGLIKEEEIREACVHVYTTRFRLGMFDEECSFNNIPYSVVNCKEHHDLALKAAEKSLVLLKNDGLLPLDKTKIRSIAVIGPNAYSSKALFGNYNGESGRWCTNLDGIRNEAGDDIRVYYSLGCDIIEEQEDPLSRPGKYLSEAEEIASISDVTVLCLGLNADLEGEEGDTGNAFASGDKPDLLLTASQRKLCDRILSLGKKVIIVINSGSALDLSKYEGKANAMIQAWYSGEAGGEALANVLFGKVSPSGKLPLTFYYNDQPLPDFTDYHMMGRTYKFVQDTPWFPFGYGLSYCDTEYNNCSYEIKDGAVVVNAEIKNHSKLDATEIAEVYIRYEGDAFEKPHHHLEGFKSVDIPAGSSKNISIEVPFKRFSSFLKDGSKVLLDGEYTIFIGGSQPDEKSETLTGKKVSSFKLAISNGQFSGH
ncbi:MAG: glycoside hydrolase family 3 C-terminal domain-containing protein [Lachnospiraceae bacterium]|nr:glycoside hydrolase family 3 C-terminal domain-containing protein [Lachnospiraceae bacterium]